MSVCLLVALLTGAKAQEKPSAASDESVIRTLEERWDRANLTGDAAALESIFADTFILTGDDGKVHTRAEVLSELKSRNIRYTSAKTEELKVRMYGNAAVVSGRWRGAYSIKGRKVTLLERFTNFYVRGAGGWQCVASHGSAIR